MTQTPTALTPAEQRRRRHAAYMALKKSGKNALPHLRKIVLQIDEYWKPLLISILREEQDREAIPILRTLAKDAQNQKVKSAANQALSSLGGAGK